MLRVIDNINNLVIKIINKTSYCCFSYVLEQSHDRGHIYLTSHMTSSHLKENL